MCYSGLCYSIQFAKHDIILFAEFTPVPSSAVNRKDSVKYRTGRNSADLVAMLGELTFSLTKQVASKGEELRRLNNLVDDVQVLISRHIFEILPKTYCSVISFNWNG